MTQTNTQTQAQKDFINMLMTETPCKGLERIEGSRSCSGVQVAKEVHRFKNNDVIIVRSQWEKTQGGWCIRINNFYANRHHFIQIPMDTLKQCKGMIESLKKGETVALWTGHFVNEVGEYIERLK